MSRCDRIVKVYESQLNAAKRSAADMTQARVDQEEIYSSAVDTVEAELTGHWDGKESPPWAAARYLQSAMTDLQQLKGRVEAAEEVELVALEELRDAFTEKRRFETFMVRKNVENERRLELLAGRRMLEQVVGSHPLGDEVDPPQG